MLSAYCWPHSGTPGSAIPLCATSSFGSVHVTVSRVGETREIVARFEQLPVGDHRVPDDAVRAARAGTPCTGPNIGVFEGTELEYGDLLGARSTVVGYECDGCAFTFVDGRPAPTGEDSCPEGFEILATSPAAPFDRRTSVRPVRENALSEVEFNALRVLGDSSPEACERLLYGNAVMGTWKHGSGATVVTVGCTDWACGLGVGDDDVERVTRNLLDRLG